MARKRNKNGIPELTRFHKKLETVYDALMALRDNNFNVRLPRKEQAVLDVCDTIAFIEGDGLHSFWYNDLDQRGIIRSFRIIGAGQVADALKESSWAKAICERGTDETGQLLFTKTEAEKLDAIEERVYDGFQDAANQALRFVRQNRLKVPRPPAIEGKRRTKP